MWPCWARPGHACDPLVQVRIRRADGPAGESNRQARSGRGADHRPGMPGEVGFQWDEAHQTERFVVGPRPEGDRITGAAGPNRDRAAEPLRDPCDRPVRLAIRHDRTELREAVAVFDPGLDPMLITDREVNAC